MVARTSFMRDNDQNADFYFVLEANFRYMSGNFNQRKIARII